MTKRVVPYFLGALALSLICGGAAAKTLEPGSRPNVLLIVADDMGYMDAGFLGSEIKTPNLDRLAKTGTILTDYYASPMCAPTRSMLMSGTDNHRAGEGKMDTNVPGAPGYEGYLNDRVVSLATRLKDAGYHTYMAGKWNLGLTPDHYPNARGFERSFALLNAGGSHFAVKLAGPSTSGGVQQFSEDDKVLTELPDDYYSTIAYTDKMLSYLKSNANDGKPFFAYLAYQAPHSPLQALAEDIARQKGKYDEGYDVIRERRFKAWKKAGFARADARLPNLPEGYKPWSSLTAEEQAVSARSMEVYAAMVERMDAEIGRVVQYLKDTGQFDNTLIFFQSDNGAAGGGFGGGANVKLEDIGGPNSGFGTYGTGWAVAGEAPFYLYKSYAADGGIHVPAFVSGAALGVPRGKKNNSVIALIDVAPTLLELAGADPNSYANRPNTLPITGRSFASVLRDSAASVRGPNDAIGWEHNGNAAVRMGDWKLVWVAVGGGPGGARGPRAGGGPRAGRGGGRGPGADVANLMNQIGPENEPVGEGGPWMLFNLKDDPGERTNLSAQRPKIMKTMLAEWDKYVAENGVIVKHPAKTQ